MLPIFRFPEFKKLKFQNFFRLTSQDEPLFQQMTLSRNKVHGLCTHRPQLMGCDQMIAAIDEYLPHLISLVEWERTTAQRSEKAESRAEKREADKDLPEPISYQWKSGCSSRMSHYSLPDSQYEIAMILAARAQLMFNRCALDAPRLFVDASATHTEDATRAAKTYREAAGIWDKLGMEIIPMLPAMPDKAPLPPELNVTFCQAMSTICLAAAQFVIFLSAIHRPLDPETGERRPPLTNPIVAAKVGMDVIAKLETARFLIDSCKDIRKALTEEIATYVTSLPPIMRAHVLLAQGEGKWATAKYGEAVASVKAAHTMLGGDSGMGAGLPKKAGPELTQFVVMLRTRVKECLTKYQHENSFIYKQLVPEPGAMVLPDASSIAKSIPYTPPDPLWTTLPSKRTV